MLCGGYLIGILSSCWYLRLLLSDLPALRFLTHASSTGAVIVMSRTTSSRSFRLRHRFSLKLLHLV